MRSFHYCARLAISVLVAFSFVTSIVQPAYAQVAPGVTQAAAQVANVTGSVIDSDGKPVAGADVTITGQGAQQAKKTDSHGAFAFGSIPYGTYLISVNSSLGRVNKPNILVTGDISVSVAYETSAAGGGLKTIANVSTRDAGARINTTAASIASVTPRDYAFQGNTNWRQMLDTIPGVAVSGMGWGGTPGFIGVVGAPTDPIVLSINGALPYETSTTLDGMPFSNITLANYDGGNADLSALPMAAFDALDIVRGPGANTPSIVNSIGGSAVLHAPGIVTKNSLNFSIGNDNWGGTTFASAGQYKIGQKLSASASFAFYNSPGPQGRNSKFLYPWNQFALSSINGQPLDGCQTQNGQGFCVQGNLPSNPDFISCDLRWRGCQTENSNLIFCCAVTDTSWSRHEYSLGLDYKVSPNVSAQLFYVGQDYRDAGGVVNNSVYGKIFFDLQYPAGYNGPRYNGSITPGDHLFSNGNGPFNPNPEKQWSWMDEEKVNALVGKGVLRLEGLQGYTYGDYFTPGVPPRNIQVWGEAFLQDPNTGVDTFHVFNGDTVSGDFGFYDQYKYHYWQWDQNRDLLGSYALQLGDRSSVAVSYVYWYMNQPWYLSQFSIFGTNFCPFEPGYCAGQNDATNASTREIRLSAHHDVSDKLGMDLSYYFAHADFHVPACGAFDYFSVCKSMTDKVFPYRAPRMGLTYRANPDTAIRAAIGGGFAIPFLYQMIGGGAPSCNNSQCTLSILNLNLQPEKSFAFDIGTDIRMHHTAVLSFDVYRANLYGQFYHRWNEAGPCGTICTDAGMPADVNNLLFTVQEQNLVPTRYEGINLSFRDDPGRPKGEFFSANLGLTRAFIRNIPANFYQNPNPGGANQCSSANQDACSGNTLLPNINFTGACDAISCPLSGAVPYASGAVTIGYRMNPRTSVSLTGNYYGPNNDYYSLAFMEWNAFATIGINKNMSVNANFQNILNTNNGSNICWNCLNNVVGAPAAFGQPYFSTSEPVGPRNLTVTLNFNT